MSFRRLEIEEMFRELSGYESYEEQIAIRGEHLAAWFAKMKRWRAENPIEAKALAKRMREKWKRENPAKWKAMKRAQEKRRRAKNPEKTREQWRKWQQDRRDRLKKAARAKM